MAIRSALHARGWRFRIQYPVPGHRRRSIDIAFTRRKLAVLVDGCFWHGCPLHGSHPAANASYWREKIRRNRERDLDTDQALRDAGWSVLRIWEHTAVPEAIVLVERAIDEFAPLAAPGVGPSPIL